MFFFKNRWEKKKLKTEKKLIDRMISQSRRFGHNFSVVAVEISDTIPRGLSKILPDKTISFRILEKNIRQYDLVTGSSEWTASSNYRKYYMIFPQTDENEVRTVKERILYLAKKNSWGDVSIKVAIYPKDGDNAQALLDKIS